MGGRVAGRGVTDPDRHPSHDALREARPGRWEESFPIHPGGLAGWRARRRCRAAGGHWWHPTGPMIEWTCCACGATRDGNPG